MPVPGPWFSGVYEGKKLPQKGYGTYKLRIILPKTREALGLKIYNIKVNYDLKVNGIKVVTVGQYGTSLDSSKPEHRPVIVRLPLEEVSILIEISVSNFHDVEQGLTAPLLIGPEKKLEFLRTREVYLGSVFLGCLIMLFLYNFIIYWSRRQEKGYLYLSISIFLSILYNLTTGSQFLPQALEIPWTILRRIDFSTFALFHTPEETPVR